MYLDKLKSSDFKALQIRTHTKRGVTTTKGGVDTTKRGVYNTKRGITTTERGIIIQNGERI
jgi:hypothetical protein